MVLMMEWITATQISPGTHKLLYTGYVIYFSLSLDIKHNYHCGAWETETLPKVQSMQSDPRDNTHPWSWTLKVEIDPHDRGQGRRGWGGTDLLPHLIEENSGSILILLEKMLFC